MRKVLIVLAALLCATAVFAADNSFNLSVTPYTVQRVTSSADKAETSSYGLGAELTYQRDIYENIYAEGGLGWNTYIYANKDSKAYTSLQLFTGVGYKYAINEKWSLEPHFDLADNLAFYAGRIGNAFSVKTGIGAAYSYTDQLTLTAKLDGSFSFGKNDGTSYVRYRVVPMIGCTYSL